MKVFYCPEYVKAAENFETVRKSGEIVRSLAARPISGVTLVAPLPATVDDMELVHEPGYIKALATGVPLSLASSQGFDWDPGLWESIRFSTGGVLAATEAALEDGIAGSLSSGLHHARYDYGCGYCSVNGLAVAAVAALQRGVSRVLILDLDAHCGGGTASLIADDEGIWQTDISVNDFDSYEPISNGTLDFVRGDDSDYLSTVSARLAELESQTFDLCLYNAGMDPIGHVSIEALAQREEIVFTWARRRSLATAWVPAGGYTTSQSMASLVEQHRLTIAAAARA